MASNKQFESPLRGWDGVAAAPQHGRYAAEGETAA
jgi:hypothetical protein